MNKKGAESGVLAVILWAIISVLIISVVLLSVTDSTGRATELLRNAPDGLVQVIESLAKIATPIVSGIFWVVAPAGEGENVQMIAFAIFLLLTLVGTKALRPFIQGPFLAFFISVIVGIIAGRSLTATILEQSALGASPIAAVSLVLGFLPIFALTKNIDRWGITQWSKMVVFTVAGFVYIIIFWLAFDSRLLGLVYGAGIVVLGATQIMAPYFRKTKKQMKAMSLGRYMAGVQETVATVQGMAKGAGRGP